MNKHTPRVLIVFNTLLLYGMERSVIELFDLLRPQIEPVFLVPRSSQRYQTALLREVRTRGFTYYFFSDFWDWPRVGKPRGGFVKCLSLLFSILVANVNVLRYVRSVHALYLPTWTSAAYSLLGAMICRLTRKKVIYFFHDLMLKDPKKTSFCVAISTDLVHNTGYSYEAVRKLSSYLSAKRNHVIPPAIELRRGATAQRWSGNRKFVFIGQVSLHKGIDLLIEAFKYVAERHLDVELDIVGGCDPKFEEQLRDLVDGCQYIRTWGYLGTAHDVLAGAYAYIHPSPPSRFNESFGRGAVEAMALGVPVICFASGALQEIVQDGVNGLVCTEESTECLRKQMTRLLTDTSLRDHLAEGALRTYSQHYSNDLVKQAWLGVLDAAHHPSCTTLDVSVKPL